jgi:hypothetical protein
MKKELTKRLNEFNFEIVPERKGYNYSCGVDLYDCEITVYTKDGRTIRLEQEVNVRSSDDVREEPKNAKTVKEQLKDLGISIDDIDTIIQEEMNKWYIDNNGKVDKGYEELVTYYC